MPHQLETLCLVLFLILMAAPGLYGFHLYLLMFLNHRRRREVRAAQRESIERYLRETPADNWPRVTTQIPLYNELPVARRVIEAVARLDYPADRHEIQVLDDSSDATREVVDQVCARLRALGHDVNVIRRPTRAHYKAGALSYGLERASGEFVAVFDADFVPDPSFLRRLIPLIANQQDCCCVQARWGHLNMDESWITRALSLGIDGHFGVEQGARGWNGFLLNFNGTAGIWRKAAITDPRVGGWSGDTITEDLDLSYRAQLAGWKIAYCVDEVCPAEIPANVNALKTQQRRWATGSIQTARKMLPAVWRSSLSPIQKIEASFHLTQYAVNVFMVLMALFGRWLLALVEPQRYQSWLESSWYIILLAAAAPSIAYIYARWSLSGRVVGLRRILQLIALGLGLSVNNCVAVLAGLVQRGGEFVRTPKSGNQGRSAGAGLYATSRSRLWLLELVLGVHCFVQWLVFLKADRYVGGTFLLLFAVGLVVMGWSSRPRSGRKARATAAPAVADYRPSLSPQQPAAAEPAT